MDVGFFEATFVFLKHQTNLKTLAFWYMICYFFKTNFKVQSMLNQSMLTHLDHEKICYHPNNSSYKGANKPHHAVKSAGVFGRVRRFE